MEQHAAVYSSIHAIEKQIDHIKLLNRLGKMNHKVARLEIHELELELKMKIAKLPKYERSIYHIKREFGIF